MKTAITFLRHVAQSWITGLLARVAMWMALAITGFVAAQITTFGTIASTLTDDVAVLRNKVTALEVDSTAVAKDIGVLQRDMADFGDLAEQNTVLLTDLRDDVALMKGILIRSDLAAGTLPPWAVTTGSVQ